MSRSHRPIRGRVVAITGGARGIGRATAAELVRRGARVAIGDVDLETARATARELGGEVLACELDVTDAASFEAFLDEAELHLGPLDVLVNNAGIMPVVMQSDETQDTTRRVIEINLHGVITGTKLALARMRPRGTGHIVNIASQGGKVGFGGVATYCASKFAVVGYTDSVDDELRDCDIHMSCVMPAIVATELSQGLPSPRMLKPIAPDDVARAIADALERPRLHVHVPRSGAVVLGVMAMLPARARRALEATLGLKDGAVMHLDPSTRKDYEARVAREVAVEREREEQRA